MTFVSLFAGIGGFDLGLERAGMTCVGQCEIDPYAQSVLRRHWPNVPLHDDVTTLKHDTFGPADVVTFGSPCQDLSIAGKRAGLEGARSGLFLEAVRYIREMLEETNGRSPRFAVWENVPGAYSSNGGRDFAAVLESLVGGDVRCPADGWPNAGVAFGPLGCAEWRTLDSQHFGVAQRRRRVFVVYRPGGIRAGEVLLESAGVPGDPPPRREAGERVAPTLEGRAGRSGATNFHTSGGLVETTGTLPANLKRGDGTDPIVPVAFKVRGGKEGGGKGYLGSEDKALTISTVQEQYLAEPVAFALRGRNDGAVPEVTGDKASALRGAAGGSSRDMIAYAIQDGRGLEKAQNGLGISGENESSYTVDTTGAQAIAIAFAENSRAELRLEGGDGTRTGALSTGGGKPGQGMPTIATAYAVRRLTPRECERLQAFPDDHTRYDHHGREIADTHRYRMLGNAVTVNVIEWIGRRILAVAA